MTEVKRTEGADAQAAARAAEERRRAEEAAAATRRAAEAMRALRPNPASAAAMTAAEGASAMDRPEPTAARNPTLTPAPLTLGRPRGSAPPRAPTAEQPPPPPARPTDPNPPLTAEQLASARQQVEIIRNNFHIGPGAGARSLHDTLRRTSDPAMRAEIVRNLTPAELAAAAQPRPSSPNPTQDRADLARLQEAQRHVADPEALARARGPHLVRQARTDYEAARQQVQQANQRLARLVSNPALTEAQRRQISEQFRADPRNAPAYAAEEAAARRLADTFEHHRDALRTAGGPEYRQTVEALARSPEATRILPELDHALSDPRLSQALGGREGIERTVGTVAESALARAVGTNGGDAGRAVESVLAEIRSKAPEVAKGLSDVLRGIEQMRNGFPASALGRAVQEYGNLARSGPLGRAFAGALLLNDLAKASSGQLKDVASLISNQGELAAGLLRVTGSASRFARGSAQALARIVPFAGIAAAGLSAAERLGKLGTSEFNNGEALGLVGDALSAAGSALGPGFGTVLSGLGSVVSTAGDLWSSSIQREQLRNETLAAYQRAGIDRGTAERLYDRQSTVGELVQAGLSPEQVQHLARTNQLDAAAQAYAEGINLRSGQYGDRLDSREVERRALAIQQANPRMIYVAALEQARQQLRAEQAARATPQQAFIAELRRRGLLE